MTDFTFEWDKGCAEVQSLGGMLGPISFILGDGMVVEPLSIAPWASDSGPEYDALPGVLKRMRGEWPCVPFGMPSTPDGLPEGWTPVSVRNTGNVLHGYSANNLWNLESRAPGGLEISIRYPEDQVVERLTRSFRGISGKPEIEITLGIEARQDTRLPISLHPVFRLPDEPGGMKIRPAPFAAGFVYPVSVVPGAAVLQPGARFDEIGAVPAIGGFADLSRLPLQQDAEEIIQLCGIEGPVVLENEVEGYRATLDFDREVFPSVQFWISNRGRGQYPWNRKYVGLGIEPVCAAFDLGPEIGCSPDNPIARAGFKHPFLLERTSRYKRLTA